MARNKFCQILLFVSTLETISPTYICTDNIDIIVMLLFFNKGRIIYCQDTTERTFQANTDGTKKYEYASSIPCTMLNKIKRYSVEIVSTHYKNYFKVLDYTY